MLDVAGRMDNRAFSALWAWQVIPVTCAIVGGPLITAVYRLTGMEVAAGTVTLAQGLRGLLCLAMFLSLHLSQRARLLEHVLTRPLVFLAGYAVLAAFLSPYPYENIVFAVQLGFAVLVFANAFNLGALGLCRENWLALSAGLILVFMGVSQAIGIATGTTVAMYDSPYATAGLMGQPAVTSALIISCLPVFLRYFPERHSPAGVMVLLGSLFLTMRRTALLSALCASLMVVACKRRPPGRAVPGPKIVGPVLLLIGLTVAGLLTPAGADFLARVRDLDPRTGSGSGRYVFWSVSLQHILGRDGMTQFLGEGMGSIRDTMYREYGHAIGSHTAWLDLTHAFGVFGLVAICWWYFELMRFAGHLRRLHDRAFPGVLAAIVVLFLESLGQGGFSDPSFALVFGALGFWASPDAQPGRGAALRAECGQVTCPGRHAAWPMPS